MIKNRVLLDLQALISHIVWTHEKDLKSTINSSHNANVGVKIPSKFTDDIHKPLVYLPVHHPIFIDQEYLEDDDIVPIAINSPVGMWELAIEPISYPTPENGFMYAFRIEPTSSDIAVHRILLSNNNNTSYSLEWCTYDAIKSGDNPVINVDTKYSTEVSKNMDYMIGLNNFADQEHPSILDCIVITFNENEFLNGELDA